MTNADDASSRAGSDGAMVLGRRGPERLRFSPAPSGALHLGGARTALFNWLVARHTGGSFVLRIEDTDAARCGPECEAGLVEDLAWLGLDWDEGPEIGGEHGPYRQSERNEAGVYTDAMTALVETGAVYACFCSEEELAAARRADEAAGVASRYSGPCCELPGEESKRRLEAGEPAVWRFRVTAGEPVRFDDAVHGPMTFEREGIGDFVVGRSDGTPVYDLAAAVDDAAMRITLVVRGDDHLSNTPRQILLAEALGMKPPAFAHLPLVHGADGRPLAKRRGAVPIAELREGGYLPEAVLNHIALLGWSHPEHIDVLSREELVASFDLARVGRAAAQHDPARLDWLDERHIRDLPANRLVREVGRVLPPLLPGWFSVERFAEGVRGEIATFAKAAELAAPLLERPGPTGDGAAALASGQGRIAVSIADAAIDAGLRSGVEIAATLKRGLADAGLEARDGLPAVRAALTGSAVGLPLALIIDVIGPEESRSRLRAATM